MRLELGCVVFFGAVATLGCQPSNGDNTSSSSSSSGGASSAVGSSSTSGPVSSATYEPPSSYSSGGINPGASSSGSMACSTLGQYGLWISLQEGSASGGAGVPICGGTVTATKSSSTETLYLAPGTCVHKGGWTAGHYRVDVSASGYQPVTDPDVEVVRSDPVCPFIFKTEKTYVLHRQSAASSSGGGSGTSSSGP